MPAQQYVDVDSYGGPYFVADNNPYANYYAQYMTYPQLYPTIPTSTMSQPNSNQQNIYSNSQQYQTIPTSIINQPHSNQPNSNQQNIYSNQQNIPPMHLYPQFEGILVPVHAAAPTATTTTQQQPSLKHTQSKDVRPENKLTPARSIFDLAILLQALLPPSVLQLIVTWSSFVFNSFSIIVFAGLITSAICTITPICTLTFGALPMSFQRQFPIPNMTYANGTEVSMSQRVRRATKMLSTAFEKYDKLQKNVESTVKTLKLSLNARKMS